MRANLSEKQKLLQWIDEVSFMVIDLTLYLDTHPNDEEAMDYFRHYLQLRKQALKEYASMYGPLLIDDACPEEEFTWALMKWPWEGGDC